jgi:hypothetical protein
MRFPLFFLFCLLCDSLHAGPLNGTWQLDTAEGSLVATLSTQGNVIAGSIAVHGRPAVITLTGMLRTPESAAGVATSESGTGRFEAQVAGEVLNLVLSQDDEPNQRAAAVPLQFRRAQAAAPPAPASAGKPAAAPRDAGGDARLEGAWEWQEVINSGDASFAQSEWLEFRADGTFASGKGPAAAGGAGWSYDGGGAGGAQVVGRWKAKGGVLFALGVDGKWVRVGAYGMTDDGRAMRVTSDDGWKRVWQRR